MVVSEVMGMETIFLRYFYKWKREKIKEDYLGNSNFKNAEKERIYTKGTKKHPKLRKGSEEC